MEEVTIEQECCICYLETNNKTICMHDVCIDCGKKIDKCPICRINLIKNIDDDDDDDDYLGFGIEYNPVEENNNIEVGEIFIPLTGEPAFFNNFEVSNFRNVRNIQTGKIFRPFLENGIETVIIDEGNSSKFKFTVDELLLFA